MRGDRLKQRREEMGLSQAELGSRLKLEGQAIYRYEKGQTDPAAELLGKLAKELDVTADWLLGLVGDQHDYLSEESLSPDERKLIAAVRAGRVIEAMESTLQLAKRDE